MTSTNFFRGETHSIPLPQNGILWSIVRVGREPNAISEPKKAKFLQTLWKLPSIHDSFSRNILEMFSYYNGNMSIRLVSDKNQIQISPKPGASGITLNHQNAEFFVPANWYWNLTILINNTIMFRTQAVSGHPKNRIASFTRIT